MFENGCILPHPYYSKKGKDGPARFRGHQASIKMFHKAPIPVVAEKNDDGWPMENEISHLCHWSSCMNPDHLVWEARW